MAKGIHLRVAHPCSQSWSEMQGTDRVRHCAHCKLNVFNISEMSEAEVREVIQSATGRVCVRLYQRPDGTVLTRDCPVGVARVRQKVALAATVFLALSVGSVAVMFKGRTHGNGSAVEEMKDRVRNMQPFKTVIDWIDPPRQYLAGDISAPLPPKGP